MNKIKNQQIKIMHITNLESALKIIKDEKYIPVNLNLLHFDSCLNCFCTKIKDQSFKNSGVIVYFEWYGSIKKIEMNNTNTPFEPNILYNQEPWRCFIPLGSSKKLLKITDVKLDNNQFDDNLNKAVQYIQSNNIFIRVG